MPNNLNSLYSFNNNVSVSSNNFTTLYNATTGNISTGNVSERNFTTLYTNQADINPTRPYGNSNVEAFLNVGSDAGGNVVENINANGTVSIGGNLNVSGETNLGLVGNVHIDGGNYNYVLATDGAGNLTWTQQTGGGSNATPYIHFAVTTTGNNQQFTDANIAVYPTVDYINLFKNGINIEPFYFQLINPTTIQVDILLNAGDTIDILASGAGGGGGAAGNTFDVQFNGSGLLSGNSQFTFNPVSGIVTLPTGNISNLNVSGNSELGLYANVANIDITNIANISNANITDANVTDANIANLIVTNTSNLGNVGNITITGGSPNYVLSTDGTGNLDWVVATAGVPGGANTQVQFNDSNVFGGDANFTFDKTTTTLTSNNFIATSTANLGNVGNVIITGGSANYVLSTDGSGNLNWITPPSSLSGLTNSNVVALGNNFANTATSGTVLVGDNANGSGGAVSVGASTNSGSGGVTLGYAAGNAAGVYNIAIGIGAAPLVSGVFNTVIGVDGSIGNAITGNNNILIGRSVQASSSTVDGEITIGGQYNTNTRIPFGNLNVTGNANFGNLTTSNYFSGNGSLLTGINGSNVSTVGNANYAAYAGNVVDSTQSNITSLGTLTSLTVADNFLAQGNVTVQRAFEVFTPNATGSTGTVNYDVLTQSIIFKTANATANCTLNIRGDSTTSLNTILPVNQDVTVVYLNTVGATAYIVNSVTIDGTSVTPKYVNGSGPTVGTRLINSIQSYTFSILKTAANTYTVLGSLTEYQ